MKSKFMVVAGLLVLGVLVFGPMTASAQTWALASVDYIGVDATEGTSIPAIQLTEASSPPVFTNQYFRFASVAAKEMLATALTAQSLGLNLTVRIKADGLTIDVLWIKAE